MTLWFEKFGWSENPFVIKPAPDHIVGFEDIRNEIVGYVESQDAALLLGVIGAGKTTLLRWLEQEGLKKYETIYLNLIGVGETVDIDEKIRPSFWKRLLMKKPVVVLVDEVQSLPSDIGEALKRNFDDRKIHALILASPTDELPNIKESLLDRVGERKVRIRPLTEEEAFQLVERRVEKNNPFTKEALKTIFVQTEYSPRKILEACELVCKHVAEVKEEKDVTKPDVDYAMKRAPVKSIEPLTMYGAGKPQLDFLMSKLSPLQRKIIRSLSEKEYDAMALAQELKTSRNTITKQISRLTLIAGDGVMQRKGITKPIIVKVKTEPATYGLVPEVKRLFAKE